MVLIKQFLCDRRAAISIAIIGGARSIGLAIQNKFFGPLAANLS
jgi:hypothetical protein